MSAHTHWTLLRRERPHPAFAPTPLRKDSATASSAKLTDWENEGGSLALPAVAPKRRRAPDCG